MPSVEYIAAGEFCAFHHVELSFIKVLHDSGLVAMTIRDGSMWLLAEELPALERFVRWHYDLAINSEGVEALAHLLQRMNGLQEENRLLRNRLRSFEGRTSDAAQAAEEI
jgi:hypothetical protein